MAKGSREKIKLDFLGIHFYGNISALEGEPASGYPSFSQMIMANAPIAMSA